MVALQSSSNAFHNLVGAQCNTSPAVGVALVPTQEHATSKYVSVGTLYALETLKQKPKGGTA